MNEEKLIREIDYLGSIEEYLDFIHEHFGIEPQETLEMLEAKEFEKKEYPTWEEILAADGMGGIWEEDLAKKKRPQDYPKGWFALIHHARGSSIHKDLRIKANSHLSPGFTITDQVEGAITEKIKTVSDLRKWKWNDPKFFKFQPDMGDKNIKTVVVPKADQPLPWLGIRNVVFPPGSVGACFKAGTLVYTNKGLIPIEEVSKNTLVYSSKGKWRKVLEPIVTINETRTCYEIFYNRYMQAVATENHPFLIAKLWYKNKSISKRIKEIKWMSAGELFQLSQKCHGLETIKFAIPRTQNNEKGTRKEGLIVGFILGDGWLPKYRKRIVISFNARTKGRLARYYEHLLDDLKIKVGLERIRRGNKFEYGTIDITFESVKLKKWIKELRKNPSLIFSFSKEFAEGVYQGLLDADGYKNAITQKKLEVVRLIPLIILHADRFLHFRNDERTNCKIFTGSKGIISEDSKFLLRTVEIRKTNIPDKTYNLSVEKDESYLIPNAIAHNTRFEPGVFLGVDEGMAHQGVQKPYFKEWFLKGRYFKGRFVVRLIPVRPGWVKKPKGKLQFQCWMTASTSKGQLPYLLSPRGRSRKDVAPPEGESWLPPEWETKIKQEFRWWPDSKSKQQKIGLMEEAYNDLIERGEIKARKLKLWQEGGIVTGSLLRISHGQYIPRELYNKLKNAHLQTDTAAIIMKYGELKKKGLGDEEIIGEIAKGLLAIGGDLDYWKEKVRKVLFDHGLLSIRKCGFEDFEYLLHHIHIEDGKEEIHHCFLYDHIANLFEQAHLAVKKGAVYLEGKKIQDGIFHVVKGLESTQEASWSDAEAEKNKIKPKAMKKGMGLREKAKEW